MKHDWNGHFSIYKMFKGNRFATLRNKVKNLGEVIDDMTLLAALDGEDAHSEAREFSLYCENEIIPLMRKCGDDAAALALCCYLFCHFNDEKVVMAEVYDLFHQVGEKLEETDKYKDVYTGMSANLHHMKYYISLAGVSHRSNYFGLFRPSNYNDRMEHWPINPPKDLCVEDLLNVASLLSSMAFFSVCDGHQETTTFIGLSQTIKYSNEIVKRLKILTKTTDGMNVKI